MTTRERMFGKPTVDVPSWSTFDDQAAGVELYVPVSGIGGEAAVEYLLSEPAMAELQRYFHLNEVTREADEAEATDLPVDTYSCNEFRMYEFKVRRCARGRSHDWTECPYAHPGEKARRRDPREHRYSGTACPDFRKGSCKKGDSCEFAHGVFECWLHPARYRTQPCKDGTACRRRVCFFAHTPEQLRVPPPQQQQSPRSMESYNVSPLRYHALDACFAKGRGMISSSPTSTLISRSMSSPADSPPVSPSGVGMRRASWPMGSTVSEVIASLEKLHFRKVRSMPRSWGSLQVGDGLGSPMVGFRPGFCSLPSTPTGSTTVGHGWLDLERLPEKDEPVERVESGRALRAKMYERRSKESGLDLPEAGPASPSAPDVGWISQLFK